jgi:transposase
MLRAMIEGEEDPLHLTWLAHRRLQPTLPELRLALEGRVSPTHRFLLKRLMSHLEFLESEIALFDERIEEQMAPCQEEVSLVLSIPGIQRRLAENRIAEIGPNMNQFPTAAQLASWAGVCPGNQESGGKRRRAKTPKGNRWLQRTLGECAWGAGRATGTSHSAQYARLAPWRGAKRAIVAVGHRLLLSVRAVLIARKPYQDRGADPLQRLNPERLIRYHVRKLESLGVRVNLTHPPPSGPNTHQVKPMIST